MTLALAVLIQEAQAASLLPTSDCDQVLNGEITDGDLKELEVAFPEDESNDRGTTLCLNSPGGSFLEGVRIARYLRKAGVPTKIRRSDVCLSACAVAFMGGATIADDSVVTNRELNVSGVLGFHAPYLLVKEGQYDKTSVENAYAAALLGVAELAQILSQIDFPSRLMAEMLRKGSSDFYFIDRVGRAGEAGIELVGYAHPTELADKHWIAACDNIFNWHLQAGHTHETFSLQEYTRPIVSRKFADDTAIIEVGAYPPEASRICTLKEFAGIDGRSWTGCFSDGPDSNRCENKFKSYYFFAPETMLSNLTPQRSSDAAASVSALPSTNRSDQLPATPGQDSSSIALVPSRARDLMDRKPNNYFKDHGYGGNPEPSFAVGVNTAVTGDDREILKRVDHQACSAACSRDPQCLAYVYDKWNRWCFLKGSVGVAVLDPKYTSGHRSTVSLVSSTAPTQIQRYRGKAFPNGGRGQKVTASFKYCEQRCDSDRSCMAFTYHKSSRECMLLDDPGEYVSDPDADSGVKRQAPSQ